MAQGHNSLCQIIQVEKNGIIVALLVNPNSKLHIIYELYFNSLLPDPLDILGRIVQILPLL